MNTLEGIKKYPVAIIAGFSALVFGGLGFWRAQAAAEDHELLAKTEIEATRLEDNIHNAQRLEKQVESMDLLMKGIESRLANPADVAANQQYFYKLEADNSVKLIDLHRVVSNTKNKKGQTTHYSELGYSLNVQGDYSHLLGFLRSLESGNRITRITSGGVASGGRDPSALSLTLNVELLGSL